MIFPGEEGVRYAYGDHRRRVKPKGRKQRIDELGVGIRSDAGAIFVPLKELETTPEPVYFEFGGRPMKLNFSLPDLTAWVVDMHGQMITGTLVYHYVWQAFWPKSKIQKRFSEHNPSP